MARICFVTHSEYPREPRARRMAEALVDRGHDVDVLCLQMPDQPAGETVCGVQVVRLPETRHQGAGAPAYLREYARFFFLAGRELRRRHRARPYALVQVHNPPDALVFCTLGVQALPLGLRRVPVALDLRELMPELFMSRFGLGRGSIVVRLLTLLERWACRYASVAFVLHERHRRIMLARGIPAGKLIQVMNCPDERIFGVDVPATTRSDDGRDVLDGGFVVDGSFVVICHGGIFRRYGTDLLVQAISLVRPEIPGVQLELYGEGDYQQEVERLALQLGIRDVVRFHGQRPIEEMPAALARADVGVAPLRQDVFTDCGLPTKLLEYVMLGIPAVASRTATTADYFDDSMVLLFEPGSAQDLAEKLRQVWRDPVAARARVQCARSFTARYNWQTESATYVRAAERLLQQKGKT